MRHNNEFSKENKWKGMFYLQSSFPKMEEKLGEFSEFRESEKSPKYELGPI